MNVFIFLALLNIKFSLGRWVGGRWIGGSVIKWSVGWWSMGKWSVDLIKLLTENILQKLFPNRSSHSQVFLKISVPKKICNIHRKTPALEPLFNNNSSVLRVCNIIKKTL